MRPRSPLPFLSSLLLLLAACTARPAELSVFAAASLRESFTEIARGFEAAHPGTRVMLNFAGSQQLVMAVAVAVHTGVRTARCSQSDGGAAGPLEGTTSNLSADPGGGSTTSTGPSMPHLPSSQW